MIVIVHPLSYLELFEGMTVKPLIIIIGLGLNAMKDSYSHGH